MKNINTYLTANCHVHFMGIGGVGMSALARVLCSRGFVISGSDIKETEITTLLRKQGCAISIGDERTSMLPDVVIYSSAISKEHPMLRSLRSAGVPAFHRSELLGYFMNNQRSIGVTGTHGKTTTSALLSFVLSNMNLNPTCFVGGKLLNFDDNSIVGDNDLVVAEVDESDKSLLNIKPQCLVLTNLEEEHMDTYEDIDDLRNTFGAFISEAQTGSVVVYNADDPYLSELVPKYADRSFSYGIEKSADFTASHIVCNGLSSSFILSHNGETVTDIQLPLAGKHNIYNALAVCAAVYSMKFELKNIKECIRQFKGTGRRMEIAFQDEKYLIVDDYAHHPTEVKATVAALQVLKKSGHITVVFQPHRFSRVKHCGEQFGSCFDGVDHVVVTDVYSAGEERIEGVSAHIILNALQQAGVDCVHIPKDSIIAYLLKTIKEPAVIAFLGAGDISEKAYEFSNAIKDSLYSK